MNGKTEMSDAEIQTRLRDCAVDDSRRVEMLKSYCTGKNILDFGCGFGGYLKGISSVVESAVGVELGLTERKFLKSAGFTVTEKIDEYEKTFDVITLFHVFEHLAEPRSWLKKFARYLKQGGLLFIEVPNGNDALLSLYGSKEFADFTYWSAHLYLYTQESLTALINDVGGYVIEDAGQIQRYPLSNHLYWLAKEKAGGHKRWDFFNSPSLNDEYEKVLKKFSLCDTLFYRLRKVI